MMLWSVIMALFVTSIFGNTTAHRDSATTDGSSSEAVDDTSSDENLCNGELPQSVIDTIIAACQGCDKEYGSFFDALSGKISGTRNASSLSPLEEGRLLCSRLDNISSCYGGCNQGYDYQYVNSYTVLLNASDQLCVPTVLGCSAMYIPSCYEMHGAHVFNGTRMSTSGCDPIRNRTLASISQCIKRYANQQNCTGQCSANHRLLKFNKIGQEAVCQIPPTSVVCSAEVQLCLDQTYGPLGTKFMGGDFLTSATSDDICSQGRRFSACMTNTLGGTSVVGNAPCYAHSKAIKNLIAISDALFQPFCDNPSQNFNSVCPLEPRTVCLN